MISNQIIQTSIDELKAITKVDIYVFDLDGIKVAATTEDIEISREIITGFAASPADSQVVGGYHFLKVLDDSEVAYVLASRSNNDDAYMVGKIAVSQIQNLIIAYKERFDRNNFFQNLILDNLLLVDIYNRAQKLHIEVEGPRIVYLVETRLEKDSSGMELLRSLFSSQNGDYITAVDEKNIILIKAVERDASPESLELVANTIVDMMNSEAMLKVRVSYGTVVQELREVSKSYKEATMAMDVGRIFYAEKNVIAYSTLGIGRLIYQLPVNLCRIFIEEIFNNCLRKFLLPCIPILKLHRYFPLLSIFQCIQILHIVDDHHRNLKGHRILKGSDIQPCRFLQLFNPIYKSISVYEELSARLGHI